VSALGGIALDGSRAYLSWGHFGFSVLDVSNPATPEVIGEVDVPEVEWLPAI
jgi:hypothetical protein